jgi:hypothetical protein
MRDPSAWYSIVVSVDTTNATATDRLKIYINGVRVTDFGYNTTPTLNADTSVNSTNLHSIGYRPWASDQPFDGYLSDINFIDGQALDATSFGETVGGYWKKKDYTGSYGTNGFRLTFQDDVVSEGFNAVTYRGTASYQSISGLGFKPDLVWLKGRNTTGVHGLWDSIRGANYVRSDATDVEVASGTNGLQSFDGDGFTVGPVGTWNGSGNSYIGWAWDAGNGSAASNTDGTITSTVKANPNYGFSVVSYTGNGSTGQSVGTGLSSSDLVIIKNRSATASWHVITGASSPVISGNTFSLDNGTNRLNLNLTNGYVSYSMDAQTNVNGNNYIAYCFSSVAGYSSIGSYTGNGSASGPTVTTGFPVAFVMVKRTDSTGNWVMYDNTRVGGNPINKLSYANLSNVEATWGSGGVDFNATGFQVKNSGGDMNVNGGNFIYMAFADTREAAFWKDVSGQGNHWTPNNLDYRDSLPDSPANNFAVMNPLDKDATWTLSEGNLKVSLLGVAGDDENIAATMAVPNSKLIYFEAKPNNSLYGAVGIAKLGFAELNPFTSSGATLLYLGGGGNAKIYVDGSIVYDIGATWSLDIIGVAVDMSNSKVWFSKNGSWLGSGTQDPETNTGGFSISPDEVMPYGFKGNSNVTQSFTFNFGQDSTFAGAKPMGAFTDANNIGNFQYAPPAGYLTLCTANLPTPTIVDGSAAFNTTLWTGNGITGRAITGVGHQPDFLWVKGRNLTISHYLQDSVRGATKYLYSDGTNAEGSTDDTVDSFDSDGFTLGNDGGTNASSYNYVGWSWKAGGTAVSNTAGTITSQVSANVDAGFSISSFASDGAASVSTIGHGLNNTPEMVFWKNRDATSLWLVYHKDLTSTQYYLQLHDTAAEYNANTPFFSVSATTMGVRQSSLALNGNDCIAYAFHSVDGYSKVGSYTGNGSADGPFVYTGFRPAWIMIKKSSASGTSWYLLDNKRDVDNVVENRLIADGSNAEGVGLDKVDFLSNGFKLRENASTLNHAATYIFLAFAEVPFKVANAR